MTRIEERIAQAHRDLEEIAEQVAQGELDEETAGRLRERYEDEIRQLQGDDEADDSPEVISGKWLLGIGGALVIIIAVLIIVVRANTDSAAGVEGVAEDVVTGESVDLDSVTNEQLEAVVAQNPNIPGMRLALADRYFFEGDFSNALTHYMYLLEDLGVQDSGALANVGWMTYQSGRPDLAESFVVESLAVLPNNGNALWYLANIRFFGLGDAAGAAEPLRQLLGYENVPDEVRTAAEDLLADVEASL